MGILSILSILSNARAAGTKPKDAICVSSLLPGRLSPAVSQPSVPDLHADVRASELNTHAFCAKAWHLQHVLKVPPSRDATRQRVAGVARHERHGQAVATVARARYGALAAAVLLVLGLLLAVLARWVS